MDQVTVDFTDGFMRGISCGCSGCDFVPLYGATEFTHSEETIRGSLNKHFSVISATAHNARKWLRINNFTLLEADEWKEKLESILVRWVDTKSKYDNDFIESYKDDLLDQIHELVGPSPQCFYANIEHESFDYDNETIGFTNDDKAFYLHFSFSD